MQNLLSNHMQTCRLIAERCRIRVIIYGCKRRAPIFVVYSEGMLLSFCFSKCTPFFLYYFLVFWRKELPKFWSFFIIFFRMIPTRYHQKKGKKWSNYLCSIIKPTRIVVNHRTCSSRVGSWCFRVCSGFFLKKFCL